VARPPRPPGLYRIAVNAALEKIRRHRDATLLGDSDTAGDVPDWSADAAQAVLQGELRQEIEVGVSRLPEELRPTLILRDIEGLSTAETAAALDLSEAAVKSRLHRARVMLREYLARVLADE
jgi:RNA polymerase sigma-70 factor, ECF subfamily